MMRLEAIGIELVELNRLCPFHLVLTDDNSLKKVSHFGPVIHRMLPGQSVGADFGDIFEVTRPRGELPAFSDLCESDKIVAVRCKEADFSLRGMFVRLDDNYFLYYCSVELTSASAIQPLGLQMSDFSPADPTADMLILHRFREMQMHDQQKQIDELNKLVKARDTLDRDANTDVLTGIGNRRLFFKQAASLLCEDSIGQITAIALMDLDGFKKINDTYGHDVGDTVLQQIGKRCDEAVRKYGIASRLGGDEFVVLVRMTGVAELEALLDDLMRGLCQPIECARRRISLKISIGVALLNAVKSVDEAILYADLAMYEGRKKCKGTISWFTPEMQSLENTRKALSEEIRNAIENNEFVPFFQPIMELPGLQVHGYEALARWFHPTRGLIFPDTFIELAAEAGCLHKLDYAILKAALDQLSIWDFSGHKVSLHVNLCATSVRVGLDVMIMELLSARNIDPARLTVELTETTLLDFGQEEKELLMKLGELGINIQLDDFGTGFSSLTHLHDYPVTGVKIDRSFLADFPEDSKKLALIESVLAIANKLDIAVVTEGIEDQAQMQWVTSVGCCLGQGYFFSKPMSPEDCTRSLNILPIAM